VFSLQTETPVSFHLSDGLVMGHVAPDSDSIASSVAVAKYLRCHGKEAHVYIPQYYPKYLQWIIDENPGLFIKDTEDSFCKKVNFLYVVDCEPTQQRTGFPIEHRHNWFNIDHHVTRFKGLSFNNEFKNAKEGSKLSWYGSNQRGDKYFLQTAGSTCSILAETFEMKYDILALGIYHDTLSMSLHGVDSCRILSGLDISNERLETMIGNCKTQLTQNEWNELTNLRVWFDQDSCVCVGYDPSPNVENSMALSTLKAYCKVLVFFYKNGNCSLRTHLKDIDLSAVALSFGGGGHKAAAGFKLKDTRLGVDSGEWMEFINVLRTKAGCSKIPEDKDFMRLVVDLDKVIKR
jgi:phosphoesterase RecJ-like protein